MFERETHVGRRGPKSRSNLDIHFPNTCVSFVYADSSPRSLPPALRIYSQVERK